MTDPRADPSQKPTVQMPSEGQRALARAIVGEMLPEMRSMIREEVANAVLDHHERIRKLETRVEEHASLLRRRDADVTGTHSVEELTQSAREADARVKRKLARLEMESVAARAIEKAESRGFSGWMQRHGWKAAIAAALLAFEAFMKAIERIFLK